MLHTSLEQFQIILLFSIKLFCFDFSVTNLVLVNFLVLLFFGGIVTFFSSNVNYLKETSFCFIPSTWQMLVETIYETSLQLLFDNINKDGESYFPFISVIFTFVLFSNLIGLIPYSFTTTSRLIVTFSLSFFLFVKLNIICIQKHKFQMLALFIPSNTSFGLALLLVPIELLFYFLRYLRHEFLSYLSIKWEPKMILAFLARISVGILISVVFGVSNSQGNTALCIGAAIVNFGPDEVDPLLETNLAKVLEPNLPFKEGGDRSIDKWDLTSIHDSFRVLLEGKFNTGTSNLCVNYKGSSHLYDASTCWLDYVADSDGNEKLLMTGKPVGMHENNSSTIDIPIGELKTLEEVDLKFIPKRYKRPLFPFPFPFR